MSDWLYNWSSHWKVGSSNLCWTIVSFDEYLCKTAKIIEIFPSKRLPQKSSPASKITVDSHLWGGWIPDLNINW